MTHEANRKGAIVDLLSRLGLYGLTAGHVDVLALRDELARFEAAVEREARAQERERCAMACELMAKVPATRDTADARLQCAAATRTLHDA